MIEEYSSMKRTNSIATFAIALIALFSAGFACNKSDSSTTPATPDSSKTPVPAAIKDITGNYDVTGTNENGAGNYKGTLKVIEHGDVYQFTWDVGKQYDGVGVKTDNTVAAAFTGGTNGTGCGVVLYKIGADGSLDGKAGYWGTDTDESEKANRTSGSGLEGDYSVTGKNTKGNEYKGTLKIKAEGGGYSFVWNTGSPVEGFGIKQGDMVAVGLGGKQCGFVSYEIAGDGTLNGKWGGSGTTSVGTETAKKK